MIDEHKDEEKGEKKREEEEEKKGPSRKSVINPFP